MANLLVVDVDTSEILAMLDKLGPRAEDIAHAAAGETAVRVQEEARARARRRTGRFVEAITREEADEPLRGWRVFVDKMTDPNGGMRAANFPLWQEYGTKFQLPQPTIMAAAALEQGPHLRRISDGLQEAIDEVNGIGGT